MATWNNEFNQEPKGSRNPGSTYGPATIRDTRSEFQTRVNKEHLCSSTSTIDGFHRKGSFKCYYADTAPQFRPDGTTELSSQDEGRIWVESTNNTLQVYNGSSWRGFGLGFPVLFAIIRYPYVENYSSPSGWTNTTFSNEEGININGASRSGSYVELPVGKYICKTIVGYDSIGGHNYQHRIYDITNDEVLGIGGTFEGGCGGDALTYCYAYFELTGTTTITVQVASEGDNPLYIRGKWFKVWKVG